MGTGASFKLNKSAGQIIKESGVDNGAALFAAEEARKLMHDYVPMKTGALADNVQISAEDGRGVIFYAQPYAGACYYGETKNFSKDKNEKASAYWDRAMLLSNKGVLAGRISDYIKNKGG